MKFPDQLDSQKQTPEDTDSLIKPKGSRQKKSLRTRIRKVLVVFTVLAVLVVGAAIGRLVFPKETIHNIVESDVATMDGTVTMADVIGLDLATAQYVLSDSGLRTETEVTHRPAAGKSNRVLEQHPAPRQDVDAQVTLVVSEETAMPNFTGKAVQEVEDELASLGAVVLRVPSLDVSQPPEHVLSTNPPAGEMVDNIVEVVVAAQGEGLSLLNVTADQRGQWSTDRDTSLNGERQSEALLLRVRGEASGGWWILGRNAASVTATIGVADHSDPGGYARIIFIGDDEEIGAFDVRYGSSHEVEVPLKDVLRLEIMAETESDDDVVVVLGEPILRVSTEGAAELTS